MGERQKMFSDKDLREMIVPLFLEQFLVMLVGIADTLVVSHAGEAAAFPFSGALSSGLRAAGDVKFTMVVSVLSTIGVRLLLSYLLGIILQMGVIGIAAAMVCDWMIRAVIFIWRQRSGKWKGFQVIA